METHKLRCQLLSSSNAEEIVLQPSYTQEDVLRQLRAPLSLPLKASTSCFALCIGKFVATENKVLNLESIVPKMKYSNIS